MAQANISMLRGDGVEVDTKASTPKESRNKISYQTSNAMVYSPGFNASIPNKSKQRCFAKWSSDERHLPNFQHQITIKWQGSRVDNFCRTHHPASQSYITTLIVSHHPIRVYCLIRDSHNAQNEALLAALTGKTASGQALFHSYSTQQKILPCSQ